MKNIYGIDIYENLKEVVDPSHTCLVVWDVQNGLVDRIFNREVFLAAIKPLIESLRGRMPVFYTLITPLPREFRSSWNFYSMMRRFKMDDPGRLPEIMAPGSVERQIPEVVKPRPGDVVLEKAAPTIFMGTHFEWMLRNRNISTIIFSGITTEIGVESSARDASNRGFYPVVVSDCVSSMDQAAHERSLQNMTRLFIVEDSDSILKAVG